MKELDLSGSITLLQIHFQVSRIDSVRLHREKFKSSLRAAIDAVNDGWEPELTANQKAFSALIQALTEARGEIERLTESAITARSFAKEAEAERDALKAALESERLARQSVEADCEQLDGVYRNSASVQADLRARAETAEARNADLLEGLRRIDAMPHYVWPIPGNYLSALHRRYELALEIAAALLHGAM